MSADVARGGRNAGRTRLRPVLDCRAGFLSRIKSYSGFQVRQIFPILTTALLGAVLSVLAWFVVARWEDRATLLEFNARTNNIVLTLQAGINEDFNQIVALRAVTGLGYEAEMAPGGEEALTAFARSRFDAILMDCQMPGMDGYQVAAEMRRLEALETAAKPTPIIAMTANVIEGDQQKCVAAGMNDYLSKPMRLAPLARALERWTTTAAHSLAAPGA